MLTSMGPPTLKHAKTIYPVNTEAVQVLYFPLPLALQLTRLTSSYLHQHKTFIGVIQMHAPAPPALDRTPSAHSRLESLIIHDFPMHQSLLCSLLLSISVLFVLFVSHFLCQKLMFTLFGRSDIPRE